MDKDDNSRGVTHKDEWKDSGVNPFHRKYGGFIKNFIGVHFGADGSTILVDCRVYETRRRYYCCIWIYDKLNNGRFFTASAFSGEGQHYTASVGVVLQKMNIVTSRPVIGKGNLAAERAIKEIMSELGYKENTDIITAHP